MGGEASSVMLDGYVSYFSSEVVNRIKANGLRVLGMSNMDEMGVGDNSFCSARTIQRQRS